MMCLNFFLLPVQRLALHILSDVCVRYVPPCWRCADKPVTFPEPSHFIRMVINHRRNNVPAWNSRGYRGTGEESLRCQRGAAWRAPGCNRQNVAMVSSEDRHPAVTSAGTRGLDLQAGV